jgi:hypothetical protein
MICYVASSDGYIDLWMIKNSVEELIKEYKHIIEQIFTNDINDTPTEFKEKLRAIPMCPILNVDNMIKYTLIELKSGDWIAIMEFFSEPSLEEVKSKILISKKPNRGTGAGGANTNKNGLNFEEQTCNNQNFINQNYTRVNIDKVHYYLCKETAENILYAASKNSFKSLMKTKFGHLISEDFRNRTLSEGMAPDEAHITYCKKTDAVTVKILEKKHQNGPGSVEEKLKGGPITRKMYEKDLGGKIKVEYAFCVSQYLETRFINGKLKLLSEALSDENIPIFFGDNKNYFESINKFYSN